MLVSTKGKYALRVLIDIAEHKNDDIITLKSVANRQSISEKYLEAIVSLLVKGNIVAGIRGKNGGYRLIKDPQDITVYDVLKLTETTFEKQTSCDCNKSCTMLSECRTSMLWIEFDDFVYNFFKSYSIADLMQKGTH